MEKSIFVWEPLLNNKVFKLVKVNGKWLNDVWPDVRELNIFNNTVEIIFDDDVKEFREDGNDIIITDMLDILHNYLNERDIDKENTVHVFAVRLGVFSSGLYYEVVEYHKAYGWQATFVQNTKHSNSGTFIDTGYKVALEYIANKNQENQLELVSQVGLAEALEKSRQNIRYHLEKGNLLKPYASVDGRPAWTKEQVNEMINMKEKGLL